MDLTILAILAVVFFVLIFLISRNTFNLLYTLFYLPTHHQTISKTIVTMLFIPGTAIHEFSHAITAKLLGCEVGDIMLYPHKDKETGEFKAGSCEIEKVDPFRLSIIGVAPTIIGLLLITLIVFYIFNFKPPLTDPLLSLDAFTKPQNYILFLALFMVSATMFTSKRDIQEVLVVTPVIIILLILLYYLGFRYTLTDSMAEFMVRIFTPFIFVLGFTLVINVIIYLIIFLPTSLILRIFGMRFK